MPTGVSGGSARWCDRWWSAPHRPSAPAARRTTASTNRRRSRLFFFLGVLWVTITQSFVVTSTASIGENLRFGFELGALPLILAAVTIWSASNVARSRGPATVDR